VEPDGSPARSARSGGVEAAGSEEFRRDSMDDPEAATFLFFFI
jgi:hypothetical protein